MLHNQSLPDGYGNSPYATKRDTPELESKTSVSHRKRVPVAVSEMWLSTWCAGEMLIRLSVNDVENARSNAAAIKAMALVAIIANRLAGKDVSS